MARGTLQSRLTLGAVFVGVFVSAAPSAADPVGPHAAGPAAERAAPPDPEKSSRDLRWNDRWARVRALEYAATLTFGVGALAATKIPVINRGWDRNAVDEAVRDGLRLKDADARSTARDVSDGIFYGMLAFPFVDDLVALPRSRDVTWQLLMISGESMAVSGLTSVLTERTTGRERPFVRECAKDPRSYKGCADHDEKYQSFVGGHTLMSFTTAGLTCANHGHVPLYGGGAADIAVCAVAVSAASAEPFLRLAADHHYASDLVLGASLGFASGYGLPMLLHYGRDAASTRIASSTVLPYARGSELGLRAVGQF